MGGAAPPRRGGGAGSRSAGRGAGAAGEARPAPLGHPRRALTLWAGRPGRRPWSSRSGADRCPRQAPAVAQVLPPEPSPSLCAEPRPLGRGAPGAGKAVGPGQALGCPPACGLRPNSRLRQVRAPRTPLPAAHAWVPCVRSPPRPGACSFLTQPHLFGARKFFWARPEVHLLPVTLPSSTAPASQRPPPEPFIILLHSLVGGIQAEKVPASRERLGF